MRDPALKVLRLHAPLPYNRNPAICLPGRPFPGREKPADGGEEIAIYEPGSVIRMDPEDGPRAQPSLPAPVARGSGPANPGPGGRASMNLDPGAYAFLQGSASEEGEWLGLLEGFARQAWWERLECSGPYILRRVREDGKWAAQVWRALKPGTTRV